MSAPTRRAIIMGAAGRDFHDFNVYWKRRAEIEVVCFTAAQIPNIAGRVYPPALAGPRYPGGIPIHPEERLEELIREFSVDLVSFAYSDVSYQHVMHVASRVNAAGAGFVLLGTGQTMLRSRRPVIGVGAVRTGCGKSQTARRVAGLLRELGARPAVVRHPMPYGDLARQAVQRFGSVADMDEHRCTIEEREEYEPHVARGTPVFAGVDYEQVLRRAEEEAGVLVWDGGNNDLPFIRPDLHIVVADPHRAGHEILYHPGETQLRLADLVVINKVDTAPPAGVATVEANARRLNPGARILKADSPVTAADPGAVRGRRVLVIEDGPTLTHGDMPYGAGLLAARRLHAAEIVDPRPHARGSIRAVFERFPHLTQVLPAMGYGERQIAELSETIRAVPCDLVLVATPVDLGRVLAIDKPTTRVTYELVEHEPGVLKEAIERLLALTASSRAAVGPGAA